MLMNFNPLIKLLLFVPQGGDLSFFSFLRGTNSFSVSKFTCSPKKESEKLRIHISGKSMYSLNCSQFHTEFLQWMSIHYGSTYHNCHTELLCDPLGQHHCKDHSQVYSFYKTKLRHQIQFFRKGASPGVRNRDFKMAKQLVLASQTTRPEKLIAVFWGILDI